MFAGLSVEFESVITMATFSPIPLSMEQVVEALLECKSRQGRFVSDSPIDANLVQ